MDRARELWDANETDMSVSPRRTYLPGNERREQILDCALEAFARTGFHETSIADICARARIGRGTLYQYFDDKRDVLAALIDRIARSIIDAVHQWQPFELPPDLAWTEEDNIGFVEARCLQIMSVVFSDADTASLLLRMARGTGFIRETLSRIDGHVIALIEADLRAAADARAIQPCDSAVVAKFLVGGIEKILVSALDRGQQVDFPRLAREIAVLVSCGIVRGDPRGVSAA